MVASTGKKGAFGLWLGAVVDCWLLAGEASLVVPLRLARIALGGKRGKAEAQLMIGEKLEAHRLLIGELSRGELGTSPPEIAGGVATHYLGRVRANRQRLMGRSQK